MLDIRRALGSLLVAPLLLLTACAGEDAEADPPISGPVPTAPSGSASQPPKPEAAEDFIRRWAGVEKHMQNTGETEEYLAISQSCEACRDVASKVSRFYAAGGFVRWTGWRILRVTHVGSSHGAALYNVRVDSGPTQYRQSADSPVLHLAGGPATHQLSLKHRRDSWVVSRTIELAE